MRHKLIAPAVILVAALLAGACGSDAAPGAAFAPQVVEVGQITVKITPRQLDDTGAVFDITLDTHATDLSMDLTTARLEVDSIPWTDARWSGAGPGGHHRSGQLQFNAAGPAQGTARLTLSGFPDPVETSWELTRP